MKTPNFAGKQAGFTLIELIVVIVILGILAATALPRMFDMTGQARVAKMQAAAGAIRAASSSGHAAWLVNGGVLGCAGCAAPAGNVGASEIRAEGTIIPTVGGFPDVGGTGFAGGVGTVAASGIVLASQLAAPDYILTPNTTGTTITISSDAAHPNCSISYTEATQNSSTVSGTPSTPLANPGINVANLLVAANCN